MELYFFTDTFTESANFQQEDWNVRTPYMSKPRPHTSPSKISNQWESSFAGHVDHTSLINVGSLLLDLDL